MVEMMILTSLNKLVFKFIRAMKFESNCYDVQFNLNLLAQIENNEDFSGSLETTQDN